MTIPALIFSLHSVIFFHSLGIEYRVLKFKKNYNNSREISIQNFPWFWPNYRSNLAKRSSQYSIIIAVLVAVIIHFHLSK